MRNSERTINILFQRTYGLWFKFSFIFQRSSLAALELAGVVLLVRAIIPPGVDIKATAIGASLLIIGCVFEYMIWLQTVRILTPRLNKLENENTNLKAERDKLLNVLLSSAPRGAFAGFEEETKRTSKTEENVPR
jgi:hypothetical protein